MPQERLSTHAPHCVRCSAGVRKIQEVLRLKWESGLSPGQDLRQSGNCPELLDIPHYGK